MSQCDKKICSLPFTQLSFHSSGKVTPCCWLYDYELGNIEKDSLSSIWNSDKMKLLRREFIDGAPKICQKNINEHQCHKFQSDLLPHVELKEELERPVKFDLMLNGKCNLECIMCYNWKDPNGRFTEESFWQEARKFVFPYSKVIEVNGGEPFLQPDVFQLIDEVYGVNPDCHWVFTTNGHYSFEKILLPVLEKLHIDSIAVSIDSLIPEIYSKIRKKGRLETVTKTLKKLIDYKNQNDFKVVINMVLQKDNWRELPAFVDYCRKNRLQFFPFLLSNPNEFSIWDLNVDEKAEILDFYIDSNEKIKSVHILIMIQQLIKSVEIKGNPGIHLKFKDQYQRLKKDFTL